MDDAPKPRARLLLVDDHELFRAGLKALLSSSADVEVVGEAGDVIAALVAIEQLAPALVIADISMPRLNGLELAERLAASHPRVRVLILSMHVSEHYARRALDAGARAYLVKDSAPDELENAIRAVIAGEKYFSDAVARFSSDPATGPNRRAAGPHALTARQREILAMVAEGMSTKQIARQLELSVKTIDTHRAQIMQRLAIRDLASLVRFAIRHGMVRLDA